MLSLITVRNGLTRLSSHVRAIMPNEDMVRFVYREYKTMNNGHFKELIEHLIRTVSQYDSRLPLIDIFYIGLWEMETGLLIKDIHRGINMCIKKYSKGEDPEDCEFDGVVSELAGTLDRIMMLSPKEQMEAIRAFVISKAQESKYSIRTSSMAAGIRLLGQYGESLKEYIRRYPFIPMAAELEINKYNTEYVENLAKLKEKYNIT